MRTSAALQHLYLQKPVSSIVLICCIAVLPWIAMGDFSTKGESREAAVAVSMLESGDWILPKVYANEFAFKPPMMHWMIAVLSLPQGHVSEFTSRLPSAIAYMLLMISVLILFGRKTRFQEAFIAVLLLLTCFEIHRAGLTSRVDMLLTAFIVIGLIQLFRWEDNLELKGLPVVIPLILSGAILTKGPVGIILPLFVFGVYLFMLRKYSLRKIIKSMLYIGIASCFIPLLWYIEAWRRGGNDFLNVVLAENFGRFFHLGEGNIPYELGHERGVWYNMATLLAGFIPWSLFLFFSLFGLKISKPDSSIKQWLSKIWTGILSMNKIKLFSLVASVCILFFYSIPSSKRSVYLMPAYPFLALFIAQYFIYLVEYRTRIFRLFARTLFAVVALVMLIIVFQLAGILNIKPLIAGFIIERYTLEQVEAVMRSLSPGIVQLFVYTMLFTAAATLFYQLRKKINIKILYASIFVVFCVNLLIDGVVMRAVRNESSSRSFVKEIKMNYPLDKNNVYVMNDLRKYANLYGINFYMGNCFRNFELEHPQRGFFLSTEKDMPKIQQYYLGKYTFITIHTSPKIIAEVRSRIVLMHFFREE